MKRPLVPVIALAASAALAVPAAASAKTIRIADNVFKPKHVTVHKGAKVRWRWTGQVIHNVTVMKGPQRFHSETQRTGTFSHRMRRRGTYKIVCTIHPGMEMKLKVR